jgi:pimeloyl-ACP methyl ester carboxylesterase
LFRAKISKSLGSPFDCDRVVRAFAEKRPNGQPLGKFCNTVVTNDRQSGRLRRAIKTVSHSVAYARHLARGNHFAGDMSWTKPGSPPVVLAHGFMGTRGTMIPLTQRFQSDGRVVFSYHHGTFQLRSLRASAQQLVEHLDRLERELGVHRVDLVGFSMGGLIALHALKFMQAQRWIRRVALLGSPTSGTWVGLAGVPLVGLVSPSVWQVLPTSPFLHDLRDAPLPEGVRVRQISAADDAFCPRPELLKGVDKERDYMVLPGGHSSLVVSRPFYNKLREFFDEPEAEARAAETTIATMVPSAMVPSASVATSTETAAELESTSAGSGAAA